MPPKREIQVRFLSAGPVDNFTQSQNPLKPLCLLGIAGFFLSQAISRVNMTYQQIDGIFVGR